jgi:hypothetical protein
MEAGVKIVEERVQAECFTWFWNTYPQLRGTLFAVPNGGNRNAAEAARMKATGTVAGVSDLIWVLPKEVYFIEMKTLSGTQSDKQRHFQKVVEALGHKYIVLRSVVAFRALVEKNVPKFQGILL